MKGELQINHGWLLITPKGLETIILIWIIRRLDSKRWHGNVSNEVRTYFF